MDRHISAVHEGKKQFQCDICNAQFGEKAKLKIHVATVHEGKKPFQCEICNAEFTSKHGIKGHITRIHEGKKQYKWVPWIISINF